MAERHVEHASIGGSSSSEKLASVMHKLWAFVDGSALLRFVDDGGDESVWDGSAYGTPADQTFFEAAGAFIVVESVDAGEGWQVKLTTDDVGDLDIEYAPAGGWASGSFGANPTNGDLEWNDSAAPNPTDSLYLSEGDLDGYTYFRCILYDGAPGQAFYVGGYIPIEPVANTDPQVCLVRNAVIDDNAWSLAWGYSTAGVNCRNRVPVEYEPFTTDLATNGYAFIGSVQRGVDGFGAGGYGKAYDSTFVMFPIFVFASSGYCLGYFGQYTMFGIDFAKADKDTDGSGNYLVLGDIAHRWN